MTKSHAWRPWTDMDLRLIRAEYATKGPAGLARLMGRTANSIANKAMYMGLKFRPRMIDVCGEPARPPVGETSVSLSRVIDGLIGAGREVEDLGAGLWRIDGRRCTAQQAAKALRDIEARAGRQSLPVLGMAETQRYSVTGCAAQMAAEG